MVFITHLGSLAIIWIVLGLILLAFPSQRRVGVAVLLAIIVGVVVGLLILKPLIHRERPFEALGFVGLLIPAPHGSSFPSGHALTSFAAASALCYLAQGSRPLRALKLIALLLAVLISFSRLYLFVHYPSDVAAGIILGVGIGILSAKLVKKGDSPRHLFSKKLS